VHTVIEIAVADLLSLALKLDHSINALGPSRMSSRERKKIMIRMRQGRINGISCAQRQNGRHGQSGAAGKAGPFHTMALPDKMPSATLAAILATKGTKSLKGSGGKLPEVR
jgi:hypothetical protein